MRKVLLLIAMVTIMAAEVEDGEIEFDFAAIGPSDIVCQQELRTATR